jgi:hypothetical protein
VTMRSIVVAIRVRGRFRVRGVSDRCITNALNHGCRVVLSGAPLPGVRALHAPTIAEASLRHPSPRTAAEGSLCSPRARGEVRKRPRAPRIFSPDSPAQPEDDGFRGWAIPGCRCAHPGYARCQSCLLQQGNLAMGGPHHADPAVTRIGEFLVLGSCDGHNGAAQVEVGQ